VNRTSLLIANCGEIAVRIARAAGEHGMRTVAASSAVQLALARDWDAGRTGGSS
jgi:acetyl/propionyl-CoA carboxylase alpha subunit